MRGFFAALRMTNATVCELFSCFGLRRRAVALEEVEVAALRGLEDVVFEEAGVASGGDFARGWGGLPGGEAGG